VLQQVAPLPLNGSPYRNQQEKEDRKIVEKDQAEGRRKAANQRTQTLHSQKERK